MSRIPHSPENSEFNPINQVENDADFSTQSSVETEFGGSENFSETEVVPSVEVAEVAPVIPPELVIKYGEQNWKRGEQYESDWRLDVAAREVFSANGESKTKTIKEQAPEFFALHQAMIDGFISNPGAAQYIEYKTDKEFGVTVLTFQADGRITSETFTYAIEPAKVAVEVGGDDELGGAFPVDSVGPVDKPVVAVEFAESKQAVDSVVEKGTAEFASFKIVQPEVAQSAVIPEKKEFSQINRVELISLAVVNGETKTAVVADVAVETKVDQPVHLEVAPEVIEFSVAEISTKDEEPILVDESKSEEKKIEVAKSVVNFESIKHDFESSSRELAEEKKEQKIEEEVESKVEQVTEQKTEQRVEQEITVAAVVAEKEYAAIVAAETGISLETIETVEIGEITEAPETTEIFEINEKDEVVIVAKVESVPEIVAPTFVAPANEKVVTIKKELAVEVPVMVVTKDEIAAIAQETGIELVEMVPEVGLTEPEKSAVVTYQEPEAEVAAGPKEVENTVVVVQEVITSVKSTEERVVTLAVSSESEEMVENVVHVQIEPVLVEIKNQPPKQEMLESVGPEVVAPVSVEEKKVLAPEIQTTVEDNATEQNLPELRVAKVLVVENKVTTVQESQPIVVSEEIKSETTVSEYKEENFVKKEALVAPDELVKISEGAVPKDRRFEQILPAPNFVNRTEMAARAQVSALGVVGDDEDKEIITQKSAESLGVVFA